ncbi:MAG: hypothetical protein R2798_03805 [Chitinophagales bacterium]
MPIDPTDPTKPAETKVPTPCISGSPLTTLDPNGAASVLNYNLP